MYRNLRGINNQRLLEETGLWNGIKQRGQNAWKKTKAGIHGVSDGFGIANSVYDAANIVNRKKMGQKISDDELNEKIQRGRNRAASADERRKNYSDGERSAHSTGMGVGMVANPVARIGAVGGGIYGAKKLYDHYTDAMDNAQDVYDGIAG